MEEDKPKKMMPRGKPFVKGDPRCGRGKLPPELAGVKKLNRTTFIIAANKFLNMTRDEITTVLQNPKTSMIELMIGGIIAKAAKDSDTIRASFIIDRLVPKHQGADNMGPVIDAAIRSELDLYPKEAIELALSQLPPAAS